MSLVVIVSGFWGDEGKGKVASHLALKDRPRIAVRTGSVNAGHTVVYEGRTYKLRLTPSAFINPTTQLRIGAGANIDVKVLKSEVEGLGLKARLKVDGNASVIEERHVLADKGDEFLRGVVETTGTGVGPCVADRVMRKAKLAKDVEEIRGMTTDVSEEVNSALDSGETVHLEGSQGFYLSLYHGTYPFVTGRDTTTAAVLSEVGVSPRRVTDVILVLKSFVTRVGKGPLPGEVDPSEAERRGWVETATVTGRPRRAAPFNIDLAKRSAIVNGATSLAITKVDVCFPECAHAKEKKQLSERCLKFVGDVEEGVGIPVKWVGTGMEVEDIVEL